MKTTIQGFKIVGTVVEKESGRRLPNLMVKAIDKDLIFDDLLGTVITDSAGQFEIRYDKEDFQELFFDQKPDIYLKIKTPAGKEIFSTEDKVRYQGDQTEEFFVEIPAHLLPPQPLVRWNPEESQQFKTAILSNEKLMRELSEATTSILKSHQIDYPGMSYIFEPHVFEMDTAVAGDLSLSSSEALAQAILVQLFQGHTSVGAYAEAEHFDPMSFCGPMNRITLDLLEKYRLVDRLADDPTPEPIIESPAKKQVLGLMRQIVSNKVLMEELSTSLDNILQTNGITVKENQGYVFVPVLFETPIYAQKIGEFDDLEQLRAFGPRIVANPNTDRIPLEPISGIIAIKLAGQQYLVPAVNMQFRWYEGIPAPEMLRAMNVMR